MRTQYKTEDYTLTELEVAGLKLTEQHFHRAVDVPVQSCVYPVIILPLESECVIHADPLHFCATPKHVVCLQNAVNRPLKETRKNTRLFLFTIQPELYTQFRLEPINITPLVFNENTTLYALVTALYNYFAQPSPVGLMKIYALLMHIITELYERQKKMNTALPLWLPLFTKLEDELCEKMKPSVELARLFNLPVKVFLKEFKGFFGCTPKAFPNKRRVEKGFALLMTTDLTVSEIADLCGFADDSKFIREFKLRYKLSPDVYRMVHKR